MMVVKHTLVSLVFALLLGGCASRDRGQFAPANLDEATIYVFDDIGGVGPFNDDVIVVNGTPIATMDRREYTWFYVPPGPLQVSIHDSGDMSRVRAVKRLVVRPGRPYVLHYRIPRLRNEQEVVLNGYSKDSSYDAYAESEHLVLVRESDGIAMTQTHRRIPNTLVSEHIELVPDTRYHRDVSK